MNTLKGKNIFLRALESEDINYLFSIEKTKNIGASVILKFHSQDIY